MVLIIMTENAMFNQLFVALITYILLKLYTRMEVKKSIVNPCHSQNASLWWKWRIEIK
ncbi:hypothetical protein HHA03_15540 [Halolactibacillus halophilus]|uniref:Uncharacterized protein n=1 Tax=Halolactibacillus halophilus TaxID=306540 RepID=A0ABQ0VLH1_9BACI|nr:hypothetical protein HHA03_15540 [Halolactibacillus halophilus]